jgi:predicted transcriptional regulator
MADYYDGNEFQSLSQDDIIINAVKHEFDISSNKYFGLVVELLREGFVEKDPNGPTDSISLTMEGYDKSQGWFEVNLTKEEPAQTPLTDLQISILEAVQEVSAIKRGDGFVSIKEIWPYNRGMMPINYDVFTLNLTIPSLQQDLAILYLGGYLEQTNYGGTNEPRDYRYRLSQKGKDFLNFVNVLKKTQTTPPTTTTHPSYLELQILQIAKEANDKNDFVSEKQLKDKLSNASNKDFQDAIKYLTDSYFLAVADKNKKLYSIPYQGLELLAKNKIESPTTQTNLRPSPTDSATMYPTGRIKVGNDANLWKVTENKNGVKRWVKVGGIPSELPDPTNVDLGTYTMDKAGQTYRVSLVKGNKKEWVEVDSIANPTPVETPISEIDEDEVDLDILEQQLNDDSLEFDISDEDLDNLEF